MKVLVYTTLFPNHLQPNNAIFIKQRMFHFAKLQNCEIKVIAPVPYCPSWPFLGQRFKYSQIKRHEFIDGIEVFHPRYFLIPKVSMPFHGISLYLSTIGLVRRIYQTFPFDLVDGHYIYPDGFAALRISKFMNKPLILSARGSDINQFQHMKAIKPMIRYTLNCADHIISVCDALKQDMTNLGADGRRISVIPNGVNLETFYPVDKDEAKNRLSVANSRKIIVSVGSLIPRKGFHLILDALPRLVRNNDKIRLYIIGEGHYRSFLEEKIKDLNLAQYVTLVGEVANSELKFWYSLADVFCLASSREGWPNVIMESLACGTPVVATKVYGVSEILTSPDVGILVNCTSESLYNGLRASLETRWDRKLIHTFVKERDWFKVAEEVKAVFDMVLDNQSEHLDFQKDMFRNVDE